MVFPRPLSKKAEKENALSAKLSYLPPFSEGAQK